MSMFQLDDYQCQNNKCKKITEYWKRNALEDFPEKIKCEHCGNDAIRIRGIGNFDVSEGKVGNDKTGYEDSIKGYAWSKFGKYKGKRIR